jgi:hypothetical protein
MTAPPTQIKCGDHLMGVVDESVVASPSGALQNVVMCIKDAPNVGVAIPSDPAVLDQVGCVYRPHVVAMRTGQTLRVKSSDQTLHNVHMLSQANTPTNIGMTQPGYRDFVLKSAEIFRVRCDVHPWMSAHLAVFDHPFFAVTDEQGKFEIKGLPAGSYTLTAWHERFGEVEQKVNVEESRPIDVNVDFRPPSQ